MALPKLWSLFSRTLKTCNERQVCLPEDSYREIMALGTHAHHVIAFARGERAITVVPRLILKVARELVRYRHRNTARQMAQ